MMQIYKKYTRKSILSLRGWRRMRVIKVVMMDIKKRNKFIFLVSLLIISILADKIS